MGGITIHQDPSMEETTPLLETGFKQMQARNSDFNLGEMQEAKVLEYSTQVVAGILSRILAEVTTAKGTYLVYFESLNQPWTGLNNHLEKGCYLPEPVKSSCILASSAEACKKLVMTDGKCV